MFKDVILYRSEKMVIEGGGKIEASKIRDVWINNLRVFFGINRIDTMPNTLIKEL